MNDLKDMTANAALIDQRALAFRPDALVLAMEAIGRQRFDFPAHPILRAETSPENQSVRFHFGEGKGGFREVPGHELAAVLIGYCIGARIPISAKAQKQVSVTRGGVILTFTIAFPTAPNFQRAMPARAG